MNDRRRGWWWLTVLGSLLVLGAGQLEAQAFTTAGVSGTVVGNDGSPIAQALVTLSSGSASRRTQTTTTSAGTFAFNLLQSGSYELRVEALGYRPLVARPLTLRAGDDRALTLTLTAEPPPVTRVDTIALSTAASSRARTGGLQFGAGEISALPQRFRDLGGVAALSSSFGRGMGAQGLPGDMTLIVSDGLAVYRAPHPTARGEVLASPLFSNASLASVASIHDATDVEWTGAAGGYLVTTTRNATANGGVEIDAGWSGDPLWSSTQLELTSPSLSSFDGAARGTVMVGESGTLFLSAEALQHEAPLAPRIDETLAADLAPLDATALERLSQPGVESYRRYGGLARLDVQRSASTRFFVRGVGAVSERSFTGAGPLTLSGLAAPAEESVDFSTALGLVSESSRRTTLELRGGVSGSFRDFSGSGESLPPAYLAASGAHLGAAHSSFGESSRTDFILNPLLRYMPGSNSSLKFGASARASRHTMAHSRSTRGDAFFASPAQLLSGEGFGQRTTAAEESFGTQEFGVFAQYEGRPSNNVRLVVGGRYDFERIAASDAALNEAWFDASGLRSDDFETGFNQLGARFSLAWDPGGAGRTRVMLGASLHEGDVDTRAIYEALGQDVDGTSSRYAGSSLDWPEGGIPAVAPPGLPSLTLLGPGTRAPRTTNASVMLSQRVGDGTSAFVGASSRRTDFLMRRRNLNRSPVPMASDSGGRPIYGTQDQLGGMVVTTAADARRFADFGEVWALDPDGWSEYVGVTVGLEHTSASLETFATYTWSETTDNWIGAATGSVDASLEPGVAGEGDMPWSEGVSDFDRPHRAVGAVTMHFGLVSTSAVYRFESGAPFTPGYRMGVDANADGSMRNDVAFVPSGSDLGALATEWTCLQDQGGRFARRNSCREGNRHSLDVRLQILVGSFGGREARFTIEGFNLIEAKEALLDDALLLIDPNGSISRSADGSTVTLPTLLNPDFGQPLYHTGRGRMIRIGLRVGG